MRPTLIDAAPGVILALLAAGAFWLADWAIGSALTVLLCMVGLVWFLTHPSDDADAL